MHMGAYETNAYGYIQMHSNEHGCIRMLDGSLSLSLSIYRHSIENTTYMYIYIYIHVQRERERDRYVHMLEHVKNLSGSPQEHGGLADQVSLRRLATKSDRLEEQSTKLARSCELRSMSRTWRVAFRKMDVLRIKLA